MIVDVRTLKIHFYPYLISNSSFSYCYFVIFHQFLPKNVLSESVHSHLCLYASPIDRLIIHQLYGLHAGIYAQQT